jgi:hypothetical protein
MAAIRWSVGGVALIGLIAGGQRLEAKKTNEPIYQEPFDLAAGGASLTRASREGIMYANPALLPLGDAWVRWVGLQAGVMADKTLMKEISSGGGASVSPEEISSNLLDRSFHLGQSAALSFLNSNVGLSVFDRVEVDYEGQKYGDGGLPAVSIQVEGYAGGLVSIASRPLPWLSLGVTGKYLYVAEPEILVPLADQSQLETLTQDPAALQETLDYGKGMGADVGALLFFQGFTTDFSIALKVDDVGGTKLSGRDPFRQVASVGLGMAVHGTTEVLHLALDYRDVLSQYPDRDFKKIYAGARLLVRQMLGLAVGYYQGIPTFGLRIDLPLLNVGLTAYGREMGDYPGERQRNLYYGYVGMGF